MTTKEIGTTREIARLLGVTSNQVYMWRIRSHRNGFPVPVACCIGKNGSGGPKGSPMWRIEEVLVWKTTYNPKARAGAPKGNRNGYKHGRYARRRHEQSVRADAAS